MTKRTADQLCSYEKLVEKFKNAFPSVAEKAKHYQRLSTYDLLIILKDREKIIYDGFNCSYIHIPKHQAKMTSDEYRKEFSYCLNKHMEREGITQAELSELTGISKSNICDYVHARKMPGVDKLYKIADVLHQPIWNFRYYW